MYSVQLSRVEVLGPGRYVLVARASMGKGVVKRGVLQNAE